MSASDNRESNLRQLFAKLGHSLEEIRVRALQNILSKLDHSLLCDAELVQEKHLHIRLLEWFNFPSCPLQESVLSLILRLSQHPSAARIYLSIGAVEFLTQLRPNIDSSFHRSVDAIFDNLFHLPLTESEQSKQECIYHPYYSTVENHGSSNQQNSLSYELGENTVENVMNPRPVKTYTSPPDQTNGYFTKPPSDGRKINSARSEPAIRATCFKFSTFPWVALTPTDRHVLSSTDESVRSKDPSLVISVCEFLSDVVFQDFPSEVFLQRPNIVKSLASLLSVACHEKNSVLLKALQTLTDLSGGILSRLYYHQDPALYTPKQEFALTRSIVSSQSPAGRSVNSSESHNSFIGREEARQRGDGQDIDNSSSSTSSPSYQLSVTINADMIEEMDYEDICSSQLMQWTIPQFSVAFLEKVVLCLKSDNEVVVLRGLALLGRLTALLKESLSPDALWEDDSFPARELVEKFHDILEAFAEVMCHHHHHHGNASNSTPVSELKRHRMIFVGVSVRLVELLDFLVPLDRVSVAIPSEFGAVLALIYHDKSLSYSYGELTRRALALAEGMDDVNSRLFFRAQDVCESLNNACQFLTRFDELNDETLMLLVKLSRDSLLSLSFHMNLRLVETYVQLASYVCKKTSPNPSNVQQIRSLILSLLSYPLDEIRISSYSAMFDVVKDALGIEHVTEPTSSSTLAAMFIVDSKLLYEFCCFGMKDCKQIQEICSKTLLYLLQSQLLMTSGRWQQILEALTPIMAVLECWSDENSALGRCIMGLMETDPRVQTGALPILERIRGSLRLMFHRDARVRAAGIDRIMKLLSQEEGCLRKLPSFSDLDLKNLSDLFIVKPVRSIFDEDKAASVFQESDLRKVYDIFVSEVIDIDVRKSAAEQLAIIMQDVNLHRVFEQITGVAKLLDFLSSGVSLSEDSKQWNLLTGFLPSIVKILRSLVEADVSLRHRLAHESRVYYSVIRCALIHRTDVQCQKETSELLTFLIFDEMAAIQDWGQSSEHEEENMMDFSLPSCITERYCLPFKVRIHHKQSPSMLSIPTESDPIRHGLLLEMMRITWNVAWHDGVESAVKDGLDDRNKTDQQQRYGFNHLEMTVVDQAVLSVSFVPVGLRQCVYDIENATSHSAVSLAVLRISSYLMTSAFCDSEKVLHSLKWTEMISKYLLITPSSTADELLLYDILELLNLILSLRSHDDIPLNVMNCLAEMLLNSKGSIQTLLSRNDRATHENDLPESSSISQRQLNRSLLKFVHFFVGRYPYSLLETGTLPYCVHGDLAKNVLARINRAETVQSYNLSSLELTLMTLMQITARPGWSLGCSTSDCLSLSLQMLQLLLEVVSAFHVGRGGMSMSYMGRGITRCTALCLRHLAREMARQLHSQDWPRNWLFTRHAMMDNVGESGLHWLFPLWSYRDTEVRAAGVGIATALVSTESGRITMTTQCHSIPGGIWAVAFSVLLDSKECSMVRQQAALLLVNLTSQSMPSGSVLQTTADSVWQGPIVMNEETQVSLIGLSALLVLLHHTEFYVKVKLILNSLYVNPLIHSTPNVSSAHVNTNHDSQMTLTTSGSISPFTSSSAAVPHVNTGILVDIGGSYTLTGASLTDADDQLTQSKRMANQSQNFKSGDGSNVLHGTSAMNVPPLIGDSLSNSSVESNIIDDHGVVTAELASSICLLLSNLVILAPEDAFMCIHKDDIFRSLLRLLDAGLLDAYQSSLVAKTTEHKRQYILSFHDLLDLHYNIIHLIKICVSNDAGTNQQLLEDKMALKQLVLLLGMSYQGNLDVNLSCMNLWESVFSLLSGLFLSSGPDAYAAMSTIVIKHWKIIASRVVTIIQDKDLLESNLWRSALNFVALILTEDAKFKAKVEGQSLGSDVHDQRPDNVFYVVDRLDSPPQNPDGDEDIFSCSTGGAILCQTFVRAFDSVMLKPIEFFTVKAAAVDALKSLIAVSITAKVAALEAGLLETLFEHIQRLQSKMTGDVLDISLKSAKKKGNSVLKELVMTLELLRNFLFDNEDVKICACKSGLANLIHSIWSWCQLDLSLMSCVLALLCNFTAHCPQASSSLVFTSLSVSLTHLKMPSKPIHGNNSLMHCIIKLLQKESNTGNQTILKQGFTLASILALSQECRGILWKSNFLHEFSSLNHQKSKKTKSNNLLESLWLNLFVSLSFSTEGQNMILKIDDGVQLLVDFALNGQESHQKSAMLILRNLCFHSANKPKLLTNDKVIPLFLRSIEFGSSYLKSVSCSALLALLYNNQKAKGLLKSPQVMRKLQDAYNDFINSSSNQPWSKNCAETLKNVFILLKV